MFHILTGIANFFILKPCSTINFLFINSSVAPLSNSVSTMTSSYVFVFSNPIFIYTFLKGLIVDLTSVLSYIPVVELSISFKLFNTLYLFWEFSQGLTNSHYLLTSLLVLSPLFSTNSYIDRLYVQNSHNYNNSSPIPLLCTYLLYLDPRAFLYSTMTLTPTKQGCSAL